MRPRYLRLLGILGITLAVLMLSAADRAQVATRKATITFIYGDVQVRHGTAGWQAAKLQGVLNPGDAIKTAASARAEMSIGQGGYVRIDDNSHLLITHLRENGLTSFKTLVGGVTVNKWLPGSVPLFTEDFYKGEWDLPNGEVNDVADRLLLPTDIPPGRYRLSLAVIGEKSLAPALRLGIQGRAEDGWYPISQIDVVR